MFRVFEFIGGAAGWSVGEDYSEEVAQMEADMPDGDDYRIRNATDEEQFMRVLDGLEPVPELWGAPPEDWEAEEFGF